MSEQTEHPPVDKSTWGDGPWQTEPDRIEWEHAGRPCLMVRNDRQGFWCGYAAVDPGHPFHGKHYDVPDAEVHGGLTYADACGGHVCHIPKPGQPDDVWWFGFDCGHYMDVAPAMEALLRELRSKEPVVANVVEPMLKPSSDPWHNPCYRTVAYVQAETNRLAEFLAGVDG